MHTRLRVIGASAALSSPFKKQLSGLAELQSKVMVTAQQRPARSDKGVTSNPQEMLRLRNL